MGDQVVWTERVYAERRGGRADLGRKLSPYMSKESLTRPPDWVEIRLSLGGRVRVTWNEIPGWFQWRSGQEEAVERSPTGSGFVEVGTYLGRGVCSLAEVVEQSGKDIRVVGVDACQGSGIEGPRAKDYHAEAVAAGGGTFAGTLHQNVIACGHAQRISLIVAGSLTAASFFADRSIEWVHLDARHDFASVTADIAAWMPKVKAGGWLSGDDYDEVKWPDVVRAVRTRLPEARPWSVSQWRWSVA